MDSKVTEGSSVGSLVIIGSVGGAFVGKENLINFTLTNTSGNQVTRYEEVISALGFVDNGAGRAYIMPGSNIISSNLGSYFYFSKNASGAAELYYVPSGAVLQNGTEINTETITVLKGTAAQKDYTIIVRLK